ncbi:MAG: STAS domain-containing protein [Candidatus Peribacter sp.]|nr:STAS domain-containing protein [Candidatus Peribacter sp.]
MDGVLVIGFQGTHLKIIEDCVVVEFRKELMAAIGERDRVLVDFTGVDFFNSTALGGVYHHARRLNEAGSPIALCCMRPEILEVFLITKIVPGLCKHYLDRQSALAAF